MLILQNKKHVTRHIILRNMSFLCALSLALLTGCAANEARSRVENLDTTLKGYAKLIRWGYFEEATAFRHARPSSPTRLPFDPERFRDVRVTSYDETSRTLNSTGKEVTVNAEIGYYRTDMGIVKSLRYPQLWWYEEKAKHWYLDGELPDLTGGEDIGRIRLR